MRHVIKLTLSPQQVNEYLIQITELVGPQQAQALVNIGQGLADRLELSYVVNIPELNTIAIADRLDVVLDVISDPEVGITDDYDLTAIRKDAQHLLTLADRLARLVQVLENKDNREKREISSAWDRLT